MKDKHTYGKKKGQSLEQDTIEYVSWPTYLKFIVTLLRKKSSFFPSLFATFQYRPYNISKKILIFLPMKKPPSEVAHNQAKFDFSVLPTGPKPS